MFSSTYIASTSVHHQRKQMIKNETCYISRSAEGVFYLGPLGEMHFIFLPTAEINRHSCIHLLY